MTYRIRGLDPAPFRPLHRLPDEELQKRNVVRMRVTENPGFPCRISLADAPVGSTVLLLNHVSHDVANPYRASHAIFAREGADQRAEFANAVPPVFESRMLSLRAFDEEGMMADAALAKPGEADAAIRRLLASDKIAYLHVHNAVRGCFAATVERLG